MSAKSPAMIADELAKKYYMPFETVSGAKYEGDIHFSEIDKVVSEYHKEAPVQIKICSEIAGILRLRGYMVHRST